MKMLPEQPAIGIGRIRVGGGPLLEGLVQRFAGVAASLTGCGPWGACAVRLGYEWAVGLLMLALDLGAERHGHRPAHGPGVSAEAADRLRSGRPECPDGSGTPEATAPSG